MPGVRETLKNTFRNTFSRLLKRKRPSDAPQATAAVNDYAQDDEHHPVDDDHPGGHDDVVTDAETIDAYPVELATLRDSIRTSPPGTFGHLFKSVLRESVNDIGPDALLDLLHVLRKQLSCLSDEPALNIALGVVEAKRREVADPTGCAEVGVVAEVDMGKIQIPGEIAFDDTAFQTHYVAILNQARDFKKRKAAMDSATSTKKQRLGDRGEQKQVSTTVCPEQCCWVGLTDIEVQRQVRIRKPDRATRVAGYHPRSDMSLNAIVEYESFLTTSITSFTASKLVSERTAHQRKHFEQGLCQTLAYLWTSHEMKSGWLGALLQGVLFSRAISLTHDFIALELASEAISIPWLPLEPVHPRRTSMRLLNAPRTAAPTLPQCITLEELLDKDSAFAFRLAHNLSTLEGDSIQLDLRTLQLYVDIFIIGAAGRARDAVGQLVRPIDHVAVQRMPLHASLLALCKTIDIENPQDKTRMCKPAGNASISVVSNSSATSSARFFANHNDDDDDSPAPGGGGGGGASPSATGSGGAAGDATGSRSAESGPGIARSEDSPADRQDERSDASRGKDMVLTSLYGTSAAEWDHVPRAADATSDTDNRSAIDSDDTEEIESQERERVRAALLSMGMKIVVVTSHDMDQLIAERLQILRRPPSPRHPRLSGVSSTTNVTLKTPPQTPLRKPQHGVTTHDCF